MLDPAAEGWLLLRGAELGSCGGPQSLAATVLDPAAEGWLLLRGAELGSCGGPQFLGAPKLNTFKGGFTHSWIGHQIAHNSVLLGSPCVGSQFLGVPKIKNV